MGTINLKSFSLADYLKAALACAEYEQDDDLIVATVPNVVGFYSQGESHEEARMNLRDAIEGNILIALQMGWEIPQIPGVEIRTEVVATDSCSPTNPGYTRIERPWGAGLRPVPRIVVRGRLYDWLPLSLGSRRSRMASPNMFRL